MYDLKWHPRMENLADYHSKHHVGSHHAAIRPYYLHQDDSPRILPRALRRVKRFLSKLPRGYTIIK
jgi:hypothetical protein